MYGTSSGTYPYNTKSINCYAREDVCQGSGVTALVITALKPGTTYYIRPTARPNPNDDAGICNTPACGSIEQVVTTLAGDSPAPPLPPARWTPSPPDTSSYTVVPLQVGPTGECRSASTVVSPDGWSVNAGTYLGAALNNVGYGAVFEIPQGVSCKVPVNAMGDPTKGYVLPARALDPTACQGPCSMTDTRHRWIVFRTKQLNTADFPPFGVRINPSYAPKLGKFYSSQPNLASQIFDAENGTGSVHHFWFQNIELEDDPAYTNPPGAVDPAAFHYFARLGSTYQNANNQFLVLDRVYTHGPGAPIRHVEGFEIGGNYIAMVGCYTSQIETWHMTLWPSSAGTVSAGNTVLNVPQNNFRFARNTATLGMTAAATATLSGITGAGTMVGNLYPDHLEIQYTSGIGTVSCAGCTAIPVASPSTPPTALQLFTGSITPAGQFAGVNWNNVDYLFSRYSMAFGVMTSDLAGANGGPYYLENNYIDGVGEGFYIDVQYSTFSNDDITYTHNHHIWPKNYFALDPGNLWRYYVRQHWETKRMHRGLLRGNLFSYSWSYQNDGPAILLSARFPYIVQPGNDGVNDVLIESNTISHGRTGIACSSGNSLDNGAGLPEPQAIKRVQIVNNLMFDLGRWKYCDPFSCPGLSSFYFENRPGCQDLVIENNTAGPSYGEIPSILYLGGGQNLSNYLSFRKNVLYVSKGLGGYGGGNFGDWPANTVANHDVLPSASYSVAGAAPDFKANLDASFVTTASMVTPNYSWGQNMLIGGWRDTNQTLQGAADMTFAEVAAYAAHMPPGDTYATGNTIHLREQAAKMTDPSKFNYRLSGATSFAPGGIGVDYDKLASDQGLVTEIQPPRLNSDAAKFHYTAPDARACAVDVKPAGGDWSRTMDSGGGRVRELLLCALQMDTIYQHRILCYFEQVNDGVLYTDYTPKQTTNGTFRTLAAPHLALATVPFSLASVPGSNHVSVTLQPVSGSPIQRDCATSPCQATVLTGDYVVYVKYLNASGALLASSDSGVLSVR